MSALPLKADIREHDWHVSFGPIPEVTRFARILRSGYPPTVGGSPVYWPFVSLI
jgi:hypothetical protein